MKKIRFIVTILIAFFAVEFAQAQNWDAATCADICNVVADGGYNIDQVLQRCGYTHVNNMNAGDDGYLALYSRNACVDINGNLNGLDKRGVSSIVMAYLSSGPCKIVISFFTPANAKVFRDQAYQLGFKKTKEANNKSYYVLGNFGITELTDKIGRFTSYQFVVEPL